MLEIDNPPLILLIPILVVFVAPYIYSFMIDNFDKSNKKLDKK